MVIDAVFAPAGQASLRRTNHLSTITLRSVNVDHENSHISNHSPLRSQSIDHCICIPLLAPVLAVRVYMSNPSFTNLDIGVYTVTPLHQYTVVSPMVFLIGNQSPVISRSVEVRAFQTFTGYVPTVGDNAPPVLER